jgi:hypothetical protein
MFRDEGRSGKLFEDIFEFSTVCVSLWRVAENRPKNLQEN